MISTTGNTIVITNSIGISTIFDSKLKVKPNVTRMSGEATNILNYIKK